MVENWRKTYEDKVKIYDLFSKYEDENNRVLKKLLEKFPFGKKDILEIGCGSGKYTKLLAPKSKKYYALEISTPLIDVAKKKCKGIKNIDYLNCSAEEIPLENNSVDIVFASWVLTAMVSEKMRKTSIKEMLRVLKKGGSIFLFENHWEGEFMKMRGRKNIDSEKSDIKILEKRYGFKTLSIVDTNFFFPTISSAKKIVGFIFGDTALEYLKKNPSPKIKHKVVILRKKK